MGKKIDMTGWYMPEHGVLNSHLTVICEDKEYSKKNNLAKRTYWLCKCDCGNTTIVSGQNLREGRTISCGCQKNANKRRQLTGQRFDRLIVLEYSKSSDSGQAIWKCQCDCGNIIYVRANDLLRGHTKSCGCYRKDKISELYTIDSVGQKYGKLTVLKYLYNKNRSRIYLCQCDCGNTCEVDINAVRTGNTQSCGCIVSKGEYKIKTLLAQNNISFQTQKTYSDLVSNNGYPLKYDFYIDNNFLLEFDGIQHFKQKNFYTETLEARQQRDQIKNEYAKSHNIPLKRIPYWDYDKITLENIMSDKWLVKD